jgi:hypothetical protein
MLTFAFSAMTCDSSAQGILPNASVAAGTWGGALVSDAAPQYPVRAAQATVPGGVQYVTPGPAYTLPPQVALPSAPVVPPNGAAVWQAYPQPGGAIPAPGTAIVGPPVPMSDPMLSGAPVEGGPPSLLPPGTRSGVFQKAKFTATWLPQLDDDSLGWTDLRTDVVFGLPFFTRETPIVITPTYEAHFLDRPSGFDLPPRLHDLLIDFHHFRRVGDHWIADFAITPGLFADDHSLDSDDAFRLNGRAVAVYEPTPVWKWVLGVSYLDGAWSKVIPIAGVVYEPHDGAEYELVFPAPRAAWRLPNSRLPGQDEYWFYVAAEFGNAIWAFEQSDGTDDVFASRDWRLLLGLEHKVIGGLSSRAEIGYVFNREIKLASDGGDVDLDDTFLLRVGLVY